MDQQQNSEALKEFLLQIFGQMQELIGKVTEMSRQFTALSTVVNGLASTWCPDIERVVDQHADDIDALKSGQEFIGKTLAGFKKEIGELKKRIGNG